MMDCRLKADTIAKTVKLLVFMLLKTYSCSLCPSKYCCRRELFENVHGAGRQSLELPILWSLLQVLFQIKYVLWQKLCTQNTPPALGELLAHLLSWKVQEKEQGGGDR